jgi:hypothetical protein
MSGSAISRAANDCGLNASSFQTILSDSVEKPIDQGTELTGGWLNFQLASRHRMDRPTNRVRSPYFQM